jgi:glycosyltransferase involved in cell wall biosynthesis
MRYLIVGDGPSKPFLVREARELGIEDRVLFVGDVRHDNLREYYSSCDVFLFPALGEPWGLTPLEAMACEKPVIAAAEGGPIEFIQDGVDGYLVEAMNPQAYARRIISLVSDRDLMVSMGKAALRKAETFTWPQMARRFSDIYQAMLSVA